MWELNVIVAAGLAVVIAVPAAMWLLGWMTADSDESPRLDDLVLLVEPQNEMQAQVMRSKLESFGIPALLKNTNPLSFYRANWVSMLELYVRCRDLEEAREILGLKQPVA